MIKNYIRYYHKEMIWIYIFLIGIICFLFYACYNMPTYANYHDYGFTYFFSIISLCIMIFGTRYQYREFKKACIQCQQEYEEEKDFYKHMTFDNLVNRLYSDNEFDLELMGCPDGLSEEEEIEFIKEYIAKLVKGDK